MNVKGRMVKGVEVGVLLHYYMTCHTRYPSLPQVSVVAMIVFMCTVGVYANLYIFQLMRGPVLAAAALLPYAGFLLGGLVALVLRMSTKHVVTIAVETGEGGGRGGGE